jgi:hypothetical protein
MVQLVLEDHRVLKERRELKDLVFKDHKELKVLKDVVFRDLKVLKELKVFLVP